MRYKHAPLAAMLSLSLSALLPCLAQDVASDKEAGGNTPTVASTQNEDQAMTPKAPDIGSGQRTREWLAGQSGRQQASKHRATLSGPVMSKIQKRYVDSFATKIPNTPSQSSGTQ